MAPGLKKILKSCSLLSDFASSSFSMTTGLRYTEILKFQLFNENVGMMRT